jgi:hypothetical protein
MADAVDAVTGTREKYAGVPLGTRASQLPDPSYRSYLMDTFGRPPRQIACECERTTKPNIAQALTLLNGDFLQKKIADPGGRVAKLVRAKTPEATAVEELFLAALGRLPRAEEKELTRRWLAEAKSPQEGLEDVLWVLVNSREFLFNH